MNKVFVISASHNSLKFTKKFINSFKQQSYKNKTLIFIEDGSTDGSYKWLKENAKNSSIIRGSGKLWWTGAIYVGVEKALEDAKTGDYILTINSDCTFEKDYISNIVKFIKSNPQSIVGSIAANPINKDPVDAGVKIDWNTYDYVAQLDNLKKTKSFHSVDAISTKGSIYPVKIFKEIGNFNKKKFPHYLSDYEFSYRAKKFGYEILIHHQSIVYSDPKNTGYEKTSVSTLKNVLKLLFSRKSKVNILDHINFINTCCPKKLKYKNYIKLLGKIKLKSLKNNI